MASDTDGAAGGVDDAGQLLLLGFDQHDAGFVAVALGEQHVDVLDAGVLEELAGDVRVGHAVGQELEDLGDREVAEVALERHAGSSRLPAPARGADPSRRSGAWERPGRRRACAPGPRTRSTR